MHPALDIIDREFPRFSSVVARDESLWAHRAVGDLGHLRRVLAALVVLADVAGVDRDLVDAAVDGALHLFRPYWRGAHRDDRNQVIWGRPLCDDLFDDLEAIVRCATGDISPEELDCDFLLDVAACLRLAADWADDDAGPTWARDRIEEHAMGGSLDVARAAFDQAGGDSRTRLAA